MQTVTELAPRLGVRPLCDTLSVSSATYYRHRRPPSAPSTPSTPSTVSHVVARPDCVAPTVQPRALSLVERSCVLAALHEPRFVDLAPAEVYATLLDEGTYLCSERTMYRVLAENSEVRERRDISRHTHYAAPELLATKPNELWSWDITKLKGPAKWSWYHLYVVLDVYSRYVVGWMVAHRESATLAERLISTTCERQGIEPGQLTMHADRGSSMTSKPVAFLFADLGITKTHSRPHVSNDNPYSESQFKTMKYRPDFPERFGSIEDARAHCVNFFRWYNSEHRHSGLGMLTPHDVHHGLAEMRHAHRVVVLQSAYTAHPERFVKQLPMPPALPTAAWINKPADKPGNPPQPLPLTEGIAL